MRLRWLVVLTASACTSGTSVIVTVDAVGSVKTLAATASLASPTRTATTAFPGPVTLPRTFGIALPDVATTVTVALQATALDDTPLAASGAITSVPHQRVTLDIALPGVGALPDLAGGGVPDDLASSSPSDLAGADLAPVVHTWQPLSSATAPVARSSARMVHDSGRGVDVLFGGRDPNGPYNETWELGAGGWTKRTPLSSPGPRWGFAMAYDSGRHLTVVYAGATTAGNDTQTWEWDGSNWTQRTPAHNPGLRHSATMAYDARRHVCVLFGGTNGSGVVAETWEYDGNDWTKASPTASPPALNANTLAWDGALQRIVMLGGYGLQQDLWQYDGTTWTMATPAHKPPGRRSEVLVYDGARQRLVLFGGNGHSGGTSASTDLGDTWEYDGNDWTQVMQTGPSARRSAAAAFDDGRGRVVLYGGAEGATSRVPVADSWIY